MSLSAVSIRRPVLATVFSLVILLFGAIGFFRLGVREYPNVDPAIINVNTNYAGANADVIETQITEPLEEAISSVPGIRTITSSSREGRSSITVEFDLEVNLETAANDIRDKVSGAVRSLPPDADPPVVAKADADASPIIVLNISSAQRDLLELSAFASNIFKERLQTTPGVSEVRIFGERRYAMRLWIDPQKLAAYRLSPLDVRNALARENVELPSGRIEGSRVELAVRTLGLLSDPEDFNNLILREEGGKIIRFRDVGTAVLGTENERSASKGMRGPRVAVAVVPQPGSNHISISNEVYRRVEQIKKELPPDLEVGVVFDTTRYIRSSITEVVETIFIAFLLVLLIIYLFLRDWRTTIIPMAAVPVSLVGAFFIMYAAGFSINVLTLLGLVLAIGLVVDDAIVMLENIFTKIEAGREPVEAGLTGAREVFFAIVSTTVALVAVFMPIIFLQGLTGRLFKEFGIVLGGAVVISAFVALTLTPMLATKILRHRKHSRFYQRTEPFFQNLAAGYRRSLDRFMQKRWLGFVCIGAAAVLVFLFGVILPRELAPLEDRSRLRVSATAPEGTSFEEMDAYFDRLIATSKEVVPEMEELVSVTGGGGGGVNSGFVFITLKTPDQRERSQKEIHAALSAAARGLTEARAVVSQEQTIAVGGGGARFGLPVQYVLQAPNLEKLKQVLPPFVEAAREHPAFDAVDFDLKFNKPELVVKIDRNRAQALGVSVLDVAQTLQLALSGQRYGNFIRDGKQYQIIGQLDRPNRDEPADLKSLFVRSRSGELVQLDNLVTVIEEANPPQRYRFNRYISATVSAGLALGFTLGQGIAAMDEIADSLLDESFATSLSGAARDFAESSSSLVFVFILALLLTYLVLAAQFESFRDPFIIMFTVPLALAGALLTLWYFGQTLNIFSQIGLVMLIGLVTKNGILIVEFANQRKAAGLPMLEAVKDAAASRFRPILMTSLSTILGTLPIALALGAGSESRMSMGIGVIGGLVFSTGLTLYVIPAIYSYFSTERKSSDTPAIALEPAAEAVPVGRGVREA